MLLLIAAKELTPFVLAGTPAPFYFTPFGAFLEANRDAAIRVVAGKFFLYGSSVWMLREAGLPIWTSAGMVALLLSAGEAAQRYLPGRIAESTDPCWRCWQAGWRRGSGASPNTVHLTTFLCYSVWGGGPQNGSYRCVLTCRQPHYRLHQPRRHCQVLPRRRKCARFWSRPSAPAFASVICRRTWWSTTSSPWRCTCGPPIARCCAVCWRECSGCWIRRPP